MKYYVKTKKNKKKNNFVKFWSLAAGCCQMATSGFSALKYFLVSENAFLLST